jgi:hypothetical protein
VRVNSAFIANHAESRDGLLFVSGGFSEWLNLEGLPAEAHLVLVVMFEVEPDEVGRTATVDLELAQGDNIAKLGTTAITAGRTDGYVAGAPLYHTFIANFALHFNEVGACELRIIADGELLGTVRFGVRIR